MSAIATTAADHKPILAERFKTKMCRNFVTTGVCPYEQRCMFAHGDDELRTKDMNLTDQLTTEEAIKNFQRAKYAAKARAALHAVALAEETEISIAVALRVYRHDPYAQHSAWNPFTPSRCLLRNPEFRARPEMTTVAPSKLVSHEQRPTVIVP